MTVEQKTTRDGRRYVVDQSTTLEELEEVLVAGLEVLRGGEIPEEEIPGRAEAVAWIREVFTDQGGRLRQRKSLPKGASRQARGLAGLLRWHRSGGNLEGLFIAKFNAGADHEKCETLATLVLALSGTRSSAVAAWQRTGLFGGDAS